MGSEQVADLLQLGIVGRTHRQEKAPSVGLAQVYIVVH